MLRSVTTLNKKDYILLSALRKNARQTLTQISKKTRIPISTLHERLKSQQKTFIHRFATLVDFAQLGLHTRIHLQLKTTPQEKEQLRSFLEMHSQVNNLFKIAHEFDFFVEAVFEHVSDVETFIETLHQQFTIEKYTTQYITKDIKREGFLSAS